MAGWAHNPQNAKRSTPQLLISHQKGLHMQVPEVSARWNVSMAKCGTLLDLCCAPESHGDSTISTKHPAIFLFFRILCPLPELFLQVLCPNSPGSKA